MADGISYDYIWRFYQKEKQTNQLLPTGRSFYSEVIGFTNSSGSDQQRLNLERVVNELFEKRKQKIVLYVAYGRQPPSMSDAETEFYTKLVDIVGGHKLDRSNGSDKKSKLMRSLKDIPEIVLPSGGKVGPLKKDDVIEGPEKEADADYLIKNTICENYN